MCYISDEMFLSSVTLIHNFLVVKLVVQHALITSAFEYFIPTILRSSAIDELVEILSTNHAKSTRSFVCYILIAFSLL